MAPFPRGSGDCLRILRQKVAAAPRPPRLEVGGGEEQQLLQVPGCGRGLWPSPCLMGLQGPTLLCLQDCHPCPPRTLGSDSDFPGSGADRPELPAVWKTSRDYLPENCFLPPSQFQHLNELNHLGSSYSLQRRPGHIEQGCVGGGKRRPLHSWVYC